MQTLNNRPLVRVLHQGCVRNLPDENIHKKSKVKIATWNVRTLNGEYKLDQLFSEMRRLNVNILGISETDWTNEYEEAFEQENYVIIHSCRKDNVRRQGVAIVLTKDIASHLVDYELFSERLMSITLNFLSG